MIKRLIQKIKDGTALQILQELRWISRYSRRYLWAIGWYILLGILGTVISLAASVISKDIIDIVKKTKRAVFVEGITPSGRTGYFGFGV